MKIALIGYGKMGKTIEEIALERGHEVMLKVTSSNLDLLNAEQLKKVDVAIEFSNPSAVLSNIKCCLNNSTPIVVGTTGWYDNQEEVLELQNEKNGSILSATNFSVGVNLFFELNERLAEIMNTRKEYKAQIEEIHHTEKLDSPSGTAITLAEGLISNHTKYKTWKNQETDLANTVEIISKREEAVPGTHEITFSSDIDSISIKHTAKNRKGFALGAVLAAEHIYDKTGVFTMKDVLKN